MSLVAELNQLKEKSLQDHYDRYKQILKDKVHDNPTATSYTIPHLKQNYYDDGIGKCHGFNQDIANLNKAIAEMFVNDGIVCECRVNHNTNRSVYNVSEFLITVSSTNKL